jgi:hypothetical protein
VPCSGSTNHVAAATRRTNAPEQLVQCRRLALVKMLWKMTQPGLHITAIQAVNPHCRNGRMIPKIEQGAPQSTCHTSRTPALTCWSLHQCLKQPQSKSVLAPPPMLWNMFAAMPLGPTVRGIECSTMTPHERHQCRVFRRAHCFQALQRRTSVPAGALLACCPLPQPAPGGTPNPSPRSRQECPRTQR